MKRVAVFLALVLALLVPGAVMATPDKGDIDMCPNIDGFQWKVPGNYRVFIDLSGESWYCVRIHP